MRQSAGRIARFVTGHGAYLDDLVFDGLAHAVVLRSPHAHARIAGIERVAARAMPGVLAVLTADDAAADGLQPMLPDGGRQCADRRTVRLRTAAAAGAPTRSAMPGEPVALIVAETRARRRSMPPSSSRSSTNRCPR